MQSIFLKKRLDEAIFIFWLFKKHSDRMPADTLSHSLCEQYRLKCLELMREYAELCENEGQSGDYVWQNTDLLNIEN